MSYNLTPSSGIDCGLDIHRNQNGSKHHGALYLRIISENEATPSHL